MNKRICLLLSATLAFSLAADAQPGFGAGGNGGNSGSSAASPTLKSANGKTDFAKANPEDITDENFPNLIESFDYPNADISEIVKAISKLTGKNFILDS